jgi:hypothetical protein
MFCYVWAGGMNQYTLTQLGESINPVDQASA